MQESHVTNCIKRKNYTISPHSSCNRRRDNMSAVNMKRLEMSPYQIKALTGLWNMVELKNIIHEDLLQGVSGLTLHELICGGNLAYNKLRQVLSEQSGEQAKMVAQLMDHQVEERYRYVWLMSTTKKVLSVGKTLHKDIKSCVAAASSHHPSYYTWDGPGAPYAVLAVESLCDCYEHFTTGEVKQRKPCDCVMAVKDTVWNAMECVLQHPELFKLPPDLQHIFRAQKGPLYKDAYKIERKPEVRDGHYVFSLEFKSLQPDVERLYTEFKAKKNFACGGFVSGPIGGFGGGMPLPKMLGQPSIGLFGKDGSSGGGEGGRRETPMEMED